MADNPFASYSVDAGHLFDFSKELMALETSATQELSSPMQNIAKPKMGTCGLPQGLSTRWMYVGQLDELNGFMADLWKGYGALSLGATTIAGNYVTQDVTSANGLATVTDAFYPPAGTPTMSEQTAKQAAEAAAQHHTPVKPATLPAFDGSPPVTTAPGSGPMTAAQQAIQDYKDHESTYGNVENGYGGNTKAQIDQAVAEAQQKGDNPPSWVTEYLADPLHYSGASTSLPPVQTH